MTAKEKVLAKWPDAGLSYSFAWQSWIIRHVGIDGTIVASGNTEPEAWADAARRLEDGK